MKYFIISTIKLINSRFNLKNIQKIFLLIAIILFMIIIYPKTSRAVWNDAGYGWIQCWAGTTCSCPTDYVVGGAYNNGWDPSGSINNIYCYHITDNSGPLSWNWSLANHKDFQTNVNTYCNTNTWMRDINFYWTGATAGFNCIGMSRAGGNANWGGSQTAYKDYYSPAYCGSGFGAYGLGDVYHWGYQTCPGGGKLCRVLLPGGDSVVDQFHCRTMLDPVPDCTDISWAPATSTVCSGVIFTQTSNCGHTRTAIGTKNCTPPGNFSIIGGTALCNNTTHKPYNHLTWSVPTGTGQVTGYSIYRRTHRNNCPQNGGWGSAIATVYGKYNTTFDDDTASYANRYDYRVAAFGPGGTRNSTNLACDVATKCCPAVDISVNKSTVKEGQPVLLSWSSWNLQALNITNIDLVPVPLNKANYQAYPQPPQTEYKATGICGNESAIDSVMVRVNQVVYKGAFIANAIDINTNHDYVIRIKYDPRVINFPPPGFADIFAPIFKEIAP